MELSVFFVQADYKAVRLCAQTMKRSRNLIERDLDIVEPNVTNKLSAAMEYLENAKKMSDKKAIEHLIEAAQKELIYHNYTVSPGLLLQQVLLQSLLLLRRLLS